MPNHPNERYLSGLLEFLRIPSISTLPEHASDVRRAAEFVLAQIPQAFTSRLIEKEGRHPLVYAEWLGAAGAPTVLIYGHFDVQPVDPLDEWISPPFEPAIRDGSVFARGASDDKGQTYLLLKAVGSLMEENGRLPLNIKFLIEGEEEAGGEHVTEYVAEHAAELKSDAVIICDTEMFAPELPTICVGLRGIVYGEIHVEGPAQDLHSGVYGGAAPNPLMALAEILCAIKDPEGQIQMPGFYDRVKEPSPLEREAWSRLPFDESEFLAKEVGSTQLTGEPQVPVLERMWARPTFEVHGIRGGFTGEGAKTVIPARAVAKVSCRLVPDQDPVEIEKMLAQAVTAKCPQGVKARFQPLHSGGSSVVDAGSPFIQAAARAMSAEFGRETVYIRSGGSIPIVNLFQKHLGVPSVLMGFGLPDDRIHSPNEKFFLPNFYRGIDAVKRYLRELSDSV
jgi:acetylornithine deacetylase/succinyl-diaminopimelate desuccinylase-like protein